MFVFPKGKNLDTNNREFCLYLNSGILAAGEPTALQRACKHEPALITNEKVVHTENFKKCG
jgi:hypothetical protein